MSLLSLENLTVSYGAIQALYGINLELKEGEIVCLLGANGAGKSTTLRAISRLLPVSEGDIRYQNRSLLNIPAHEVVAMGIGHVPEGRGIFSSLTVLENLQLAAWTLKKKSLLKGNFERVYKLFPRLEERRFQTAGTLSGGEQQMLAVARALMTECRLILLDEPSMGLSPILVKEVLRALKEINQQGMTILLVEQNASLALKIAHRGYVLENGRLILEGPADKLAQNSKIKEAYLGSGKGKTSSIG